MMPAVEPAESSVDLQHDPGDVHNLQPDPGWGETLVALATIGPLLLTVWILVAVGML